MTSLTTRLIAVFLLIGGCSDPAEPETGVDLIIDAGECTRAVTDRLVVRVFDSEGVLAETLERDVSGGLAFPTGLRLSPRAADASRSWSITAEVISSEGTVLSVQTARGGYSEGARRELDLPFDDSCIGISCGPSETCRQGTCISDFEPTSSSEAPLASCPHLVWVDGAAGTDSPDCLDPSAPCATIQHAYDTHLEDARGIVVYVHGGSTYPVAGSAQAVVTVRDPTLGNVRAQRVFRDWPGTGRPTLDAAGAQKGFLINDAYVTIDGFEIRGADEHGVSFNTETATDGRLIHCEIWGNGVMENPVRSGEGGVIANNFATRITISDNVIRDNVESNGGGFGIRSVDDNELRILRNVISGHPASAVRASGADGSLVVGNTLIDNERGISISGGGITIEDNAICGSRLDGVFLDDGDSIFRHNSIVDSEGNAVQTGDEAGWAVEQNVFTHSDGFGLGGAGAVTNRENLYFMNAGGQTDGVTRSEPETDLVGVDPSFVDRAACDLRLGEGSPAQGASSDGSDLGARFLP